MKIRDRLTLLFTGVTAALMGLFAFLIYATYAETREDEFYRQLKQQAITKANLLLNAQVAPDVLQTIYRNTRTLHYQEEVAIYDTSFQLLYHDAVDIDFVKETDEMVRQIRQEKEIQFMQEGIQVVGFLFGHEGREYIITAASYDAYGIAKLENLRLTLIIGLLAAIGVIFLTGRFLARQALRPVTGIVQQAGGITASNLDQRLPEGSGQDEITELAVTFNKMLDRLENSFASQRQFVSNIAHELRTPLAAMIAELELAKSQKRSLEEYEASISCALQDARVLSRLSSGLLDLAKASYDPAAITLKTVRLDELLIDARQLVLKANPEYKVTIRFEQEIEEDNSISLRGNEYLLKTAFSNLMENGCKFSSDRKCDVAISFSHKRTTIRFVDKGIGIPQEEQQQVLTPFFRGSNRAYATGHGIGLSLSHKILMLHKGEFSLHSSPQAGTTIEVSFRQEKQKPLRQ